MSELIAVFTTVATQEQAEALASAAVEQRLAACVQINPIHSTYRWDGQVVAEPETRLMFKTTKACYAALERLLLAEHPYELPAVYALLISEASAPYIDWVQGCVSSSAASSERPGG